MSIIRTIMGLISDTVARPVRMDASTHSLQVIQYEHHEIHSGSYYRAGYQENLGNGDEAVFVITTPNTTSWLHFRPSVDVEAEASVMLYENPTSVTGGTSVTPRNANRNSANTSAATVVVQPTSYNLTGAIPLGNQVLGSGKSTGGNAAAENEWVLKQNTTYIMIVANQTTGANEVNIKNAWYEHTDKN